MKAAISVNATPTVLVPPGNWQFIAIQVQEGSDPVALDFTSLDGVSLTYVNGVKQTPLDPALLMSNGYPLNLCKGGVVGVCDTGESATVVVQYE